MAISDDEVASLHKANRPTVQVHLRTETTKLSASCNSCVSECMNMTV